MSDGRRTRLPSNDETLVLQQVREWPWYVRHPEDHPVPWRMLYAGVALLILALAAAWWVMFR